MVRAALPFLEKYRNNLNSFISLGVPHLGLQSSDSTLFNFGLYVYQIFKSSIALKQMEMTDSSQIEETFLMKISKMKGLSWFSNLVFVSSQQDKYVSYESSNLIRKPV